MVRECHTWGCHQWCAVTYGTLRAPCKLLSVSGKANPKRERGLGKLLQKVQRRNLKFQRLDGNQCKEIKNKLAELKKENREKVKLLQWQKNIGRNKSTGVKKTVRWDDLSQMRRELAFSRSALTTPSALWWRISFPKSSS